MIHSTESRSDLLLSRSARTLQGGLRSLSRAILHTRAAARLARRRPALALGFAVAAGSAITAATVTASVAHHQIQLQSRVEPLAPPPAPPAPPADAVKKQHHLLPFHGNPLRGLASWYGSVWNGRQTASGETFDETKLTAAHKTLPLGTLVRVTDMHSMRSVIVKINDRGTLAPNRVIDLSSAAARELGILEEGLASVKLEIVKKNS